MLIFKKSNNLKIEIIIISFSETLYWNDLKLSKNKCLTDKITKLDIYDDKSNMHKK